MTFLRITDRKMNLKKITLTYKLYTTLKCNVRFSPLNVKCFVYNKAGFRCGAYTEKKKSQNGSLRRAIWLSVTQLSVELHFGAKHDYEGKKWLSSTKESRFSKLLSKRAIALFFFSVYGV